MTQPATYRATINGNTATVAAERDGGGYLWLARFYTQGVIFAMASGDRFEDRRSALSCADQCLAALGFERVEAADA